MSATWKAAWYGWIWPTAGAMDHCPGGRACAALRPHSGMSIMTEPGLRR